MYKSDPAVLSLIGERVNINRESNKWRPLYFKLSKLYIHFALKVIDTMSN